MYWSNKKIKWNTFNAFLLAIFVGTIDTIAVGGLIAIPAFLFVGISPVGVLAIDKLQSVFGTFCFYINLKYVF